MYEDIETSTFAREVGGPGPPGLARAALLLAREIAYPDLRPSHYLARLDDWADAALWRLPATSSALARGVSLAELLFALVSGKSALDRADQG